MFVESYRLATLAAVLSEGNTCHPSGVYIYNNDRLFIQDFVAHVSQFERTVPTVRQRGRCYEVYAGSGQQTTFVKAQTPWNKGRAGYRRSGAQGSFPTHPRSGVRQWIEELGLAWVKSTEKFIPDFVFTLSNGQLALFLGRLWSGDGHVWTKTGPSSPFYATSSKRLARQVQHLLLRVGIVSIFRRNRFPYRGTAKLGYSVLITGKEHIVRFANILGPHMVGRDHALQALLTYYETVDDNLSSKDVIPSLQVIPMVRKIKEQLGCTWDSLERQSGLSLKAFYGSSSPKYGIRRGTIRQLAEYLESVELLSLATSDIYWDRIVSIEPAGDQETYDLEIEGTHNFIANNLIVHNSHSAAYALISYRTAHLKARYPVEFMAALLTSEMGNTDKLVVYLEEAKRMGLRILPPDVNESQAIFTVVDDRTIRCGLGVIKNVGMAAIASIAAARAVRGRFATVKALCRDADLRLVNRKVCDSLIKSGACDSMGLSRAALLASLDQAMEEATSLQQDRVRGQMTFFEDLTASAPQQAAAELPAAAALRDWPESQKLGFEKALLGFYVSGHPLARYEHLMKGLATATSQGLLHLEESSVVIVGGMLTKIKLTTTKKSNEQMAVCLLEDLEGDVEVLVFPNSFAQLASQLKPNAIVFIEGRIAIREDRPRLIAQQIIPMEDGAGKLAQAMELVLRRHGEKELLEQLKTLLARFPGSVPIYVRLELPEQPAMRLKLAEHFKVEPRQELLEGLGQLLGKESVIIKRHPPKPPAPFVPRMRSALQDST